MKEFVQRIKNWWRERFMVNRTALPMVCPMPTTDRKTNDILASIALLLEVDWTEFGPQELAGIGLKGTKFTSVDQAIERLSTAIMSLRWTDREHKALFSRPENTDMFAFLTSDATFNRRRNSSKIASMLNLTRGLAIAYEREKDVGRYPAQRHNRLVVHDDIDEVWNIMQSLTAAKEHHK